MKGEDELAKEFCDKLLEHARRKSKMYDGMEHRVEIDPTTRFAIEELGEVSAAITRSRWELAKYECFDLAHTAFLIWLSIERFLGGQ